LRQALGESAETHRYLHTVHGVGYRLDLPTTATTIIHAPAPSMHGLPANEPAVAGTPTMPAEDVHAPATPARSRRQLHAALWVIPLLAIVAFAGWKLWPHAQPVPVADTPAAMKRSIAVLPLINASGDADQQFFSDGLSENLITTLSQFDDLKVIGRVSSFRFRDNKEGAKAVGTKLDADYLIEGSVQRDADDVRIGIELVRTADGGTVWSEHYDRPYKDLFVLQDEIALAVTGALQIKLLHVMPGAINPGRPTSGNLDAYNAFLRGTYNFSYTGDAHKAMAQLTEATRLDPDYAQAWSWLGFVRTQYARYSLLGDAARAAYAQARAEIDTALRLQPDYGQARAIHANLLSTGYHDWNGALAEFRVALSLVSDTDPTHGAISRLLATLGKVNEAIEERRKYIAGDPLAAFARIYLADLLASQGRLGEAEASLRKAMELEPERTDWYASERSFLAILRGDTKMAVAEAKRASPGRGRDRMLTLALQLDDDRTAADAALQHLLEIDAQAKGGAYAMARVYALRGDADKTFEWLQRDWDRGDAGVHDVLFDPLLLRFRNDPRFAQYCKTAGLPPPSESEALGLDQIRAVAGKT
jgi:TolB-like protein/Tfp pilus assembly protein PilF